MRQWLLFWSKDGECCTGAELVKSKEDIEKFRDADGDLDADHVIDIAAYNELREKLTQAVEVINGVQNNIIMLTSNSSSILDGVRRAWNLNASFLAENYELQNEYLKKKGLL